LISENARIAVSTGIQGTDQLNRRSKEMMFPVLIEEAVGPNGRGHALIFMREDGEFEGLVLRKERTAELDRQHWERKIEDYELCIVAESLSTVKELISEELGL